jgi:hypothetical protein
MPEGEDPLQKFARSNSFANSQEAAWTFAYAMHRIRDLYRGKLEVPEERLLNAMQCWGLFFHDFAVLLEEFGRDQPAGRRKVFGRVLAVVIFEALDDMPHLLGRVLDVDMRAVGLSEDKLAPLERIRLELRGIRARYKDELEELRLVVGAHRDHEAEKQWDLMARQNLERLRSVAQDISNWSARMVGGMSPLLQHVATRVVTRCGRFEEQAGEG